MTAPYQLYFCTVLIVVNNYVMKKKTGEPVFFLMLIILLRFSVATQNILDLMSHQALDL